MLKTIIKKSSYFDSIFLMNAGREVQKINGVNDVTFIMGTEMNKSVLEENGALTPEAAQANANDLIISLELEDENLVDEVLACLKELTTKKTTNQSESEAEYISFEKALEDFAEANLAFISVAGEFAAQEAKKALENGMHTFIFSDNVPIAEEVELKTIAQEKGLLVMGPGCGTSIINNISLGMMSKVREGNIGLVGASGSGIHEISVLVDRHGLGISQAIGTGGRDLSEEVGGVTMIQGINYLMHDEKTKVIVLVSKPPAPSTANKIFNLIKQSSKPVVICFLGGDEQQIKAAGAYYAFTLEEAAMMAIKLVSNEKIEAADFVNNCKTQLSPLAEAEKNKLHPQQKYLRGLFCGGTHSEETILILQDMITDLHANVSIGRCKMLEDVHQSLKNSLIDMGGEEFTKGKPHPVIDPSILKDRLWKEASDPEVAVIMLDILLGYGAHPDPVATLEDTLVNIRQRSKEKGQYLSIVTSVCGSTKDPQDFEKQKRKLEELGVIVLPSNAQASIVSGLIIS